MIIVCIIAVIIMIYSIIEGNLIIGILSFVITLIPVLIWFLDYKDNKKELKKINTIEDALTWKKYK